MLRDWLSDLAMAAGWFCRNRMAAWHRRGDWCADVSEWLTTPWRWADIRARRDREPHENV